MKSAAKTWTYSISCELVRILLNYLNMIFELELGSNIFESVQAYTFKNYTRFLKIKIKSIKIYIKDKIKIFLF